MNKKSDYEIKKLHQKIFFVEIKIKTLKGERKTFFYNIFFKQN